MKDRKILLGTIGVCLLLTGCGKDSDKMIFNSDTGAITSESDTQQTTEVTTEIETETAVAKQDTVETENEEVEMNPIIKVPSWDYYILDDKARTEDKSVTLTQTSKKANNITDDDKWFAANGLELSEYAGPLSTDVVSSDLPGNIDTEYDGLELVQAFSNDDYYFCIYGANYGEGYLMNLYDLSGMLKYELDFSNYRYAPEYVEADYDYIQQKIWWADTVDNMLYVSVGHNTYAKSCAQNAYIVAIDLNNLTVDWKSQPLTSNAYNFAIVGNEIICGYGFTEEEDYLYQLDLNSGKRVNVIPLKSQAEYIIAKDDTLYVRTYDTDYTFSITQ